MEEAAAQRLRALADDALVRADTARTDLEGLLAAVERLRAELSGADIGVARTNGSPVAAPADPGVDAARLVAIEMAVAGRSREEVERHLRTSYAGPDTDAVLVDVFGEL